MFLPFCLHVDTPVCVRCRVRIPRKRELCDISKGSLWRRKKERADFCYDNEKGFIFSCWITFARPCCQGASQRGLVKHLVIIRLQKLNYKSGLITVEMTDGAQTRVPATHTVLLLLLLTLQTSKIVFKSIKHDAFTRGSKLPHLWFGH